MQPFYTYSSTFLGSTRTISLYLGAESLDEDLGREVVEVLLVHGVELGGLDYRNSPHNYLKP